jgi:CBS domain-containing protein
MQLLGVISRNDLLKRFEESQAGPLNERLRDIMSGELVTAYEDEPLRVVVYRMAETGFTRLPVVDADDEKRLLGMVSLDDLLRARTRNLAEERTRERTLRLRLPLTGRSKTEKVSLAE